MDGIELDFGSDIFNELANFKGGIDFHAKMEEKCKAQKEDSSPVEPPKKLKPSEKLIKNIENNGFNLSQMEEILKYKGNQLVVSCAGSGKTTTLVFKIMYDLKTGWATKMVEHNGGAYRVPEKIWVCTFLNTGAEELRVAYKKWVRKFNRSDTSELDLSDYIQFSTIHAEFKRALKQFGFNREIVDARTNTSYLKKVVDAYKFRNSKGNALNSEDIVNLESALTYTRNRLDSERYIKDIYDELNITGDLIDKLLFDWKFQRTSHGVVDFDDLQEMIYEECYHKNNKDLIEFLSNRYTFMYIDEFQDTSQLQYAVLQLYAQNAKQLFVIGDDDQAIYSWRGSDPKIITKKFPEDYDPLISKLSINYRCPENIVKAITPSICKNTDRYEKPIQSSKDGGEVRVLKSKNYTSMVDSLADLVNKDLKDGMSVAILCRVNSDGLMPALMFDKLNKFVFSISGKGMTLDSYIGRLVLSIVKLFTEKFTSDVKRALNLLAWDSYGIDCLMKACKSNKLSIWTVDKQDLEYSCQSIASIILKWRDIKETYGEMYALQHVLKYYRTVVFNKDSQFNNVMRSTLLSVESLLEGFEFESADSFLYELEDINERLNARLKNSKAMVKIATVHEFKGKEADSVYVWNDSANVFPVKDSILNKDAYEEERRVHYIACTRALKRSTVVHLSDSCGDFVYEMDLSNAEEISGTSKLAGEIKAKTEEEAKFKEFAQKCDEKYKYNPHVSVSSPSDNYNEFWGGPDGE